MTPYRKAIAATVTSLGAVVGAFILAFAPGSTEIAASIVALFAAAAPAAVYWVPNAPHQDDAA